MKKLTLIASSLALAGIVAMPFAAFAKDGLGGLNGDLHVNGDVNTSLATTTVNVHGDGQGNVTFSIANAKQRADEEITRRIDDLNKLSARISAMAKLSASEKTSLQANISTQISALNTLKAKVDADT